MQAQTQAQGHTQQQQQPGQTIEPGASIVQPGTQSHINQTYEYNNNNIQQQQMQQYQQQYPPPQQQQQNNKQINDWNDHSKGLQGRDFLGMDAVKKKEQKANQIVDYSIPNGPKPTVSGKKEKKTKKKFKIFG
eukprot:168592_1